MENKDRAFEMISDEQLNAVSGGGDGRVPDEGIQLSEYRTPEACHYYTTAPDLETVVYVTEVISGVYLANPEKFTLDGDTWNSRSIGPRKAYSAGEFHSQYNFVLNVQPR